MAQVSKRFENHPVEELQLPGLTVPWTNIAVKAAGFSAGDLCWSCRIWQHGDEEVVGTAERMVRDAVAEREGMNGKKCSSREKGRRWQQL